MDGDYCLAPAGAAHDDVRATLAEPNTSVPSRTFESLSTCHYCLSY